jgi:hypothetical protein
MDWEELLKMFVFPGLLFTFIASMGFAVCDGFYVSEIDSNYEGTMARKHPGLASSRYDSAMSLTVFAALTLVSLCIECFFAFGVWELPRPLELTGLVSIFVTPSLFIGCIFSVGFLLGALYDPLPPVFALLEDRDYYRNGDVRKYIDGFASAASRGIRAAPSPQRFVRAADPTSKDEVKRQCLERYLKDSQLIVPPYPVAAAYWPLERPFHLGQPSSGDLSEAVSHIESGDSGVPEQGSYPTASRYLFETAEFPVCRDVSWDAKSAVAELDACEIEVKSGTCAPGWDAGDLESWICSGFDACVREGKKDLKEIEKRPERLKDLGAEQRNVEIDGEPVSAWVLPVGWSQIGEAPAFYRKSISRQADKQRRLEPLRLYSFNVCFLAVGSIGWCLLIAGTVSLVYTNCFTKQKTPD